MGLFKRFILWLTLCLASLLDLASCLSLQAHDHPLKYTNTNKLGSLGRRSFWESAGAFSSSVLLPRQAFAGAPLAELKVTIEQARKQLDAVPAIISSEKWDQIRAILITPPLSDFWTTTKKASNILMDIADAVGNAGGDELQVLELREDLQTHLRYLDMAAYNNVFNPIKTEGTTGATKELVRSYYEDPKNELKACVSALDGILSEIANTGQ
jgi:hypothetical protein